MIWVVAFVCLILCPGKAAARRLISVVAVLAISSYLLGVEVEHALHSRRGGIPDRASEFLEIGTNTPQLLPHALDKRVCGSRESFAGSQCHPPSTLVARGRP
jgi:hypothetical protein